MRQRIRPLLLISAIFAIAYRIAPDTAHTAESPGTLAPTPDPAAPAAGGATFAYRDVAVVGDTTIHATFTVTDTTGRGGAEVALLYLADDAGARPARLLASSRVRLAPGESRRVTITADPHALARLDSASGMWRIAAGRYAVTLAHADAAPVESRTVTLRARRLER